MVILVGNQEKAKARDGPGYNAEVLQPRGTADATAAGSQPPAGHQLGQLAGEEVKLMVEPSQNGDLPSCQAAERLTEKHAAPAA